LTALTLMYKYMVVPVYPMVKVLL